MILVLGGTTEGRKAVRVLEEAGSLFYYSTKTGEQTVELHHGIPCSGAMDQKRMLLFCQDEGIRLLIDAAHPFASQLHATVAAVAAKLNLPVIRFDRIYPPRDPELTWIDDYSQLPSLKGTLLATTGVQSISRLKPFENEQLRIIFRILDRDSSRLLAEQQGADKSQICYYEIRADELDVLNQLKPDYILMKESGVTGGFDEKCKAARDLGIGVIVLRRPPLPDGFHIVNGEHGLRRCVEKLLPDFFPLHTGLTTGTCATAAAVAHAMFLLRKEKPAAVPVLLPDGETIHVDVAYGDGYAWVRKESGDDPDITNGMEIRAAVEKADRFAVVGGEGVGVITLPGFDFPPGSPAINKGPYQMIEENLRQFGVPLSVTISVPGGAEAAKKTFNPRLGIEGGISIIGVSGIIMPYSEEAFLQSIRKCLEIAQNSGTQRVVINSGAKSERFVRRCYPELPPHVFVEYGNYIGDTIRMASELGIKKLTLGIMMGKAVKLAAGNLDTHSRKTTMDKAFIVEMMKRAECPDDIIERVGQLTFAKELWTLIPPDYLHDFLDELTRCCHVHCDPLLPNGELTILLINEDGAIYGF